MGFAEEDTITVAEGRGPRAVPAAALAERIARHAEVAVDLGTGDGRFVLREARAWPAALVIGVDPVAEAMADAAARAARKPSRGGAENAVFLVATVERLPAALRGRAARVTVNYPWGSLLRAVAWPEAEPLATVAGVLAPGGRIAALLNASAGERPSYAAKLDIPALDPDHVERRLVPGWRAAGLADVRWRFLDPGEEPPVRTSWGRRLVRGSGRATLLVEATRPAPPA